MNEISGQIWCITLERLRLSDIRKSELRACHASLQLSTWHRLVSWEEGPQLSTWHRLVPWEEGPQLRNCLHHAALSPCLGEFS